MALLLCLGIRRCQVNGLGTSRYMNSPSFDLSSYLESHSNLAMDQN